MTVKYLNIPLPVKLVLPVEQSILSVSSNLPESLFYKLDLVYNASLPSIKSEITTDDDVISGNELKIVSRGYTVEIIHLL